MISSFFFLFKKKRKKKELISSYQNLGITNIYIYIYILVRAARGKKLP